jgi:hypothetical protein
MGKVKGIMMDLEEELLALDGIAQIMQETENAQEATDAIISRFSIPAWKHSMLRDIMDDLWNEYWWTPS